MRAARKVDPLECCAEIAPLGAGPLEPEWPQLKLSDVLAYYAKEAGKEPYTISTCQHGLVECPWCGSGR